MLILKHNKQHFSLFLNVHNYPFLSAPARPQKSINKVFGCSSIWWNRQELICCSGWSVCVLRTISPATVGEGGLDALTGSAWAMSWCWSEKRALARADSCVLAWNHRPLDVTTHSAPASGAALKGPLSCSWEGRRRRAFGWFYDFISELNIIFNLMNIKF